MPKVSILMPAYNAEQYISDAIQSVLSQTFCDWELILVDDCSKDSTGEICDQYAKKDNRIKVYHQKKNNGISKTKNIALTFATGKYIGFCDDDDIMHPDALRDNVLLLEKYHAEIARWSYKTVKINENGIITEELQRKCKTEVYRNRTEIFNNYENIHGLLSCDWTGLYSLEFLKKHQIEFNVDYRYGGEDTEFNIICLQHVNTMVMNENVYYTWFLRKNHSTTAKRDVNFCNTMMDVAEKEYRLLSNNCPNSMKLWEDYGFGYQKLILDYCARLPEKETIVLRMQNKEWCAVNKKYARGQKMISMYQLVRENILNLEKNMKWAIYGTGTGAETIWSIISEANLAVNVKYVLDNSGNKNKDFHGYCVSSLEESEWDIDIIIVAAEINHKTIYDRLKKIKCDKDIKIIDPFAYNFTQEDQINYIEYLENYNKKEYFEDIRDDNYKFVDGDTRVIAWYLPQYHQIDVNNKYYGQGFTEWINTTTTLPQFAGHYQPHVPYDVGYYDLMNANILKRQCYLAKKYGIYGFGFFYYWFSGKRIMEKPLELFLNHKEINMPFCLHWASEDWTKVWDGGNQELMFKQKLPDALAFWKDIIPYFRDERYIKINKKPLFIIYKCGTFEQKQFTLFLAELRELAKKDGFADIYIMLSTGNGKFIEYDNWGGDALVEYQPWRFYETSEIENIIPEGYLNPKFRGKIVDISYALENKQYLCKYDDKKYFRSALTSWDNCARKKESNALVMLGNSPDRMEQWLVDIIMESKRVHSKEENIIFISSWNEWGEGAHLEPDYKYGYAWLNAVRKAIEETRER